MLPNIDTSNGKPDVYSVEIPVLLQSHLDHLLKSKISIDNIRARGYRSIYGSDPRLKELGFKSAQCRRPGGILIPMFGANGSVVSYQYRPDHPRKITKDNGKEREIKYETPTGARNHFDIHPVAGKYAGDPKVIGWIVEGVKKADSLLTAGAQFVIALPGVANWRGTNEAGGKTAIPDFEDVAWNERLLYIAFDSDAWSKSDVAAMLQRLAAYLKNKGADVRIIKFPDGPDGSKTGADDYLAAGHNLQDIIGLETVETVKPTAKNRDLLDDPYKFEDGVMAFDLYNSSGQKINTIPLGNFSALITEVITKDNMRESTKYFKIKGFEANKTPLPTVEVSTKNFDSMDWILEHWDVRAAISSDRAAKARIKEMLLRKSYNAKRTTICTHTGWREFDGKRTFLTAGGAIGMTSVAVDLEDDDLNDYYLPQPVKDNRDSLTAALNYLKIGNPEVLLPIWASMFMCPLTPFTDPSFTEFVSGISGTKKSGITGLALNFFGRNFNYNHFPIGWNSTQNKLGTMLFKLKDLPLGIDDFAPARDSKKNRELENLADVIIRDQANRSGRGRMSSDTSIRKTYHPRGFLISQGEHLPVTYSNGARMFVVELHEGDIYNDAFFKAVDQRHLLSQAMTQYILWIDRHWDKLKEELPKQVKLWTVQAATNNPSQHARLPDAVAKLFAGLNCALSFFLEAGLLTDVEVTKTQKEGWSCFLKWSMQQSERIAHERPGKRFREVLTALKDQGKCTFFATSDQDPHIRNPWEEVVGWVDQDGYYLNPMVALNAVRKFCEHSDSPFTIGDDAVWADLKALGYSVCAEGRLKYQKKIYGESKWLIRLKEGFFFD
jgi:hypothetical protein